MIVDARVLAFGRDAAADHNRAARKGEGMTPQEAYEKRYAHIDHGRHTWDAAPKHVKEMRLAAWTMAESGEREACATLVENLLGENPDLSEVYVAAEIRARGQG
jgi:hypothetical protein